LSKASAEGCNIETDPRVIEEGLTARLGVDFFDESYGGLL
jgi:hypothetical protein